MESINEQAARWAVRTDPGPLRPEEQDEFDSWLAADSRHRGAYVRARSRWVDFDRLAALNGPRSGVPPKREVRRGISRRQLLVASVGTMAIVGGGAWLSLRRGLERYSSGLGEVRRISLEDGSTLLLNTDSEVTLRFNKQQRNIRLVRGEALFEVAHDRARPFLVVAHDTGIRAVGTAFAVRLESTEVDITVTEGVVEVVNSAAEPSINAPAPLSAELARRVSANEKIVVASAGAPEIRAIAPAQADRQLAWRAGLVSFDGESLQMAVAEINRHNRRQIVIDDPVLAKKPIVGVFRRRISADGGGRDQSPQPTPDPRRGSGIGGKACRGCLPGH